MLLLAIVAVNAVSSCSENPAPCSGCPELIEEFRATEATTGHFYSFVMLEKGIPSEKLYGDSLFVEEWSPEKGHHWVLAFEAQNWYRGDCISKNTGRRVRLESLNQSLRWYTTCKGED